MDGKIQSYLQTWLGSNWRGLLSSWRSSTLGLLTLILFYIYKNPDALSIFPEPWKPVLWHAADLLQWATAAGFVLSVQDAAVGPKSS